MQNLNGLRQVSLRAFCRKKISGLWNQETYNTDRLYNNRAEERSSLAQLNVSPFSLVLVKN